MEEKGIEAWFLHPTVHLSHAAAAKHNWLWSRKCYLIRYVLGNYWGSRITRSI